MFPGRGVSNNPTLKSLDSEEPWIKKNSPRKNQKIKIKNRFRFLLNSCTRWNKIKIDHRSSFEFRAPYIL